jgi:hypothetical protein
VPRTHETLEIHVNHEILEMDVTLETHEIFVIPGIHGTRETREILGNLGSHPLLILRTILWHITLIS